MKVWVEAPVVSGDRVLFRWRQSEPNAAQYGEEFFFRYEDIDLVSFSSQLFYEIFLALQLRVFAGYGKPVEVIFPEPVSTRSVDFWRAFHDAELVQVGPLADIDAYAPRTGRENAAFPRKTAAIFYGGGKDSVLSTGLLTEVFGDDQVVLIQYVAPMTSTAGAFAMHERRQESLMLAPIRAARRITTQRVYTDYLATFTEAGEHLRPHRQFYTAGALPALIAWGAEYSTLGDTRHDYAILPRANGQRQYVFPRSRPEIHAALSTHYRRVLGFEHTVTNINFPFTTVQDVGFLHARYPELMPLAVMCTRAGTRERWCYQCSKCMNWAVYALAAGYVDPRMDYDRALTEPSVVRKLIAYAGTGAELSRHGNAPWVNGLTGFPQTFQAICHALAMCDPDRLAGRIGAQALTNLYTMIALYGNTRFHNQAVVAQDAIELTGVDLVRRVGKLAGEHYPVVDKLPGPWLHGDIEAIIDFRTRMPHPVRELPHIRG
jgi:hypothetical protein